MEKIKYLIIFTLIIALGLLYIELTNYKNITNQLITTNNTQEKEISNLENKLKKQIDTIITLEENLTNTKLKIKKLNFKIPITTLEYNYIPDIETNTTIINNNNFDIKPTISFDENRNIEGFNIQLKQKF